LSKLGFISDLVEERLAKGKLRWLANFNELRRDYIVGEFKIPVYASGGLEERGFLLSRAFSALVTPKYKIHFLFCTSSALNVKLFRKLIKSCKSKFEAEDWVFIGLAQSQPFDKALKDAIENIADNRIGISAYSLASKVEVTSKNVLGKGLEKQLKSTYSVVSKAEVASENVPEKTLKEQLKLDKTKFEAFDLPNYLKSFVIVFALSTLFLVSVAVFGKIPAAIQPVTLSLVVFFSLVIGYHIYKTRYHATLTLNAVGFEFSEGKKVTTGKWSEFTDLALRIAPNYETFLRLYSRKTFVDIPISRTGTPRKGAYDTVRKLIKKK